MRAQWLCIFLLALVCSTQAAANSNCEGKKSFHFNADRVTELKQFPFASPYELVWADGFDGSIADTTQWYPYFPFGCRVHQFNNARNRDLQYYSKPENLLCENGLLKIRALRDTFEACAMDARPKGCAAKDYGDCILRDSITNRRMFYYTSGLIWSHQKYKFGYFEARIKIPEINGIWPAFWLYGECANEIDVFEFLNKTPGSTGKKFMYDKKKASRLWYATVHSYPNCEASAGLCHDESRLKAKDLFETGERFCDSFHVYGVEWTPLSIRFFIDSIPVKEVFYFKTEKEWIKTPEQLSGLADSLFVSDVQIRQPMNVILNVQITDQDLSGNNFGNYPAEMLVDYVRIYQRKASDTGKPAE